MNGNAPFRGEGRCLRGSVPLFLPNIGSEISQPQSRCYSTLRVHGAKARVDRTRCYIESSVGASDVMILGEWLVFELKLPLDRAGWGSRRGIVGYTHVLEKAFRLHGVRDSGYFDKISAATDALRDIYFKDLGQHLGPRIIGRFGSLPILCLSLYSKLKPFFFSGLRTISRLNGEWGAKTPPNLTRWERGGGMRATRLPINSSGGKRR